MKKFEILDNYQNVIETWTKQITIGKMRLTVLFHTRLPQIFADICKEQLSETQLNKVCLWKMEKAMALHSSTLAWKIPWMEEPERLQSMGRWGPDTTQRLHFHFSLSCIREGNGNPLQCPCLENPRDRGAWWAAVCGVTQESDTRVRLK